MATESSCIGSIVWERVHEKVLRLNKGVLPLIPSIILLSELDEAAIKESSSFLSIIVLKNLVSNGNTHLFRIDKPVCKQKPQPQQPFALLSLYKHACAGRSHTVLNKYPNHVDVSSPLLTVTPFFSNWVKSCVK